MLLSFGIVIVLFGVVMLGEEGNADDKGWIFYRGFLNIFEGHVIMNRINKRQPIKQQCLVYATKREVCSE